MITNYYYLMTNLLSEDELKIITSIIEHLENESSAGKVGIQQIAKDNYVSTSSIIKLCKKLGFEGYSELYYHLSLNEHRPPETKEDAFSLSAMLENYSDDVVDSFCKLLYAHKSRKIFAIGCGFSEFVAEYMVHRLAVSGFLPFKQVHFYDLMLFSTRDQSQMSSNLTPSSLIVVSQSGETESILEEVRQAKELGYSIIAFTRRAESTLASLSDVSFVVDSSKQMLIRNVPNLFFAKVIMIFEELMGAYFHFERTLSASSEE